MILDSRIWQLIVKLAGARSRKPNSWSSAYEAITRQGDCLFYGVNSCVAGTAVEALLDAMVEAAIKAKNHGFQYILFLGASRHLVQLFQHRKTTNRLQQIRLADLDFLTQNGLCCEVFLVPHLVVISVGVACTCCNYLLSTHKIFLPFLFLFLTFSQFFLFNG